MSELSTTPTLSLDDKDEETPHRLHRGAFWEMLISALIGLVAALVLSIEAVNIYKNPGVLASCDLSAKISCTAVAKTWQASLLGFPNSFLGLIAEPVVITIAVAALGGTRFPRWFLNAAQVVYFIGLAFAYWLFYQSYFVINALCPWCLTITITTTLVFFSLARVNILEGNFGKTVQKKLAYPLKLGADIAIEVLLVSIIAGFVIMKL